tara:strand:- start:194 stop:436 length:243 start_codon:yes stop_codon:yes gene_type:complete
MNDTKNKTSEELNAAFENFHKAAANAIETCEAFIGMDINQEPREAIFVRLLNEGDKSPLPKGQPFYTDAKAEFGENGDCE